MRSAMLGLWHDGNCQLGFLRRFGIALLLAVGLTLQGFCLVGFRMQKGLVFARGIVGPCWRGLWKGQGVVLEIRTRWPKSPIVFEVRRRFKGA